MKAFIAFAFLILSACSSTESSISLQTSEQSSNTIFLVRHAEKGSGTDPSLTEAGQKRAEALAELMSGKGLTCIHSTNYKRTLETAAPTAKRTELQVQLYDPRDLEAFAAKLNATEGVHLVVGHSNTTPQLVEVLGGEPGDAIREKTEFDRLYEIDLSAAPPTTKIVSYGNEPNTKN